MKLLISKIASLSLALLVLFSTMSFTVGIHYCGNIRMDKAILSQAESCGMHQEIPSEEKSDCCDDEVEIIKGQDQLKLQSTDFELPQPIFVQALVYTFFVKPVIQTDTNPNSYEYPPPLYQGDFQALYQVYLI